MTTQAPRYTATRALHGAIFAAGLWSLGRDLLTLYEAARDALRPR